MIQGAPLQPYGARTVLALLSCDDATQRLTPAERHVLALILDDCSNADIALARARSPRTVANQIASLLRKFGRCSRAELIARAANLLHQDIRRDWSLRAAPLLAAGEPALTPRETRAISLRARGHSVKFISYELGVAPSTVSAELKAARRRLDIRSTLELCALFGPARASAAA
jgi:DNA-binding CsgD family transcriptional regulator